VAGGLKAEQAEHGGGDVGQAGLGQIVPAEQAHKWGTHDTAVGIQKHRTRAQHACHT